MQLTVNGSAQQHTLDGSTVQWAIYVSHAWGIRGWPGRAPAGQAQQAAPALQQP